MKTQPAADIQNVGNHPLAVLSDGLESYDHFPDSASGGQSGVWQQFPTGLAGARLYCITPSNGSDIQWQAEITHHGESQFLRCFSELRARAWLAVWDKPRFALTKEPASV